jgi:RNA polymerase sigma-70 factor (ECF subfamily)
MLRESPDHRVDVELVRAAARGERSQVDELFRRLGCVPLILATRNRRLGNALDSDLLQDLAQECLIAIWTHLDRFQGQSSLEAWVYRFCLHKHLTAVRDRGRRLKIEAIETPLLGDQPGAESRPEIDEEHLLSALGSLADLRARIVQLKHFEERTFDEIAAQLGLSPNTVKTHYYRALKALREDLQRRGVQ